MSHPRTFSIPALILSSFWQILPSLPSNSNKTLLPLTKYLLHFLLFSSTAVKTRWHSPWAFGFPSYVRVCAIPTKRQSGFKEQLVYLSLLPGGLSPPRTPSSGHQQQLFPLDILRLADTGWMKSLLWPPFGFRKHNPPSLFRILSHRRQRKCLRDDSARKEKQRRKNRGGGGCKREGVYGNSG